MPYAHDGRYNDGRISLSGKGRVEGAVIIICPACGARNRVPDASARGKKYSCHRCKNTLPHGARAAVAADGTASLREAGLKPTASGWKVVGVVVICMTIVGLLGGSGWAIAGKVSLNSREGLEIVMYPNEILRATAEPVDGVGEEEQELAALMENTLRKLEAARLSAPQVGVSKRLVVVKLARRSRVGLAPDYEVVAMVNPEISQCEGTSTAVEGCLSLPRGEEIEVTRCQSISVRYMTLEGQEALLEETGLNARQIQHEIDHLDGILVIDYAKRFNFNSKLVAATGVYVLALAIAVGLYTRRIFKDQKRAS